MWHLGCRWLGRDPERGESVSQPDVPGIMEITEKPRRYGFHATLKPPMRLAHGFAEFYADVRALAASFRTFLLPPLQINNLYGFLALELSRPCQDICSLANQCVSHLDRHRVLEPPERRAQRGVGRSDIERENILRWGYPFVFESFRFHITLSGDGYAKTLPAAAAAHFGTTLAASRTVAEIAIFVEPEPGAAMLLHSRLSFRP